jgi:hypothetical protein
MSNIKRVVLSYMPKGASRERLVKYVDVPLDKDGYADASEYLPVEYDLMYLKIEGKGIKPGWWNGNRWDGLNIKPDDKVLYWKRNMQEQD